jgi:hypothetical protein
MSDHTWAVEQVAAYVAGGLDAVECERFDAHARDCPACATALADARSIDRGLSSLFASVRPRPLLEDDTIQKLRTERTRQVFLRGWPRKLAVGVAASVGLGLTGAAASRFDENGTLPLPGLVSRSDRVHGDLASLEAAVGRFSGSFPTQAYQSEATPSGIKREAVDDAEVQNAPGTAILGDLRQQTESRRSITNSLSTAAVRDPEKMAGDLAENNRARFGEGWKEKKSGASDGAPVIPPGFGTFAVTDGAVDSLSPEGKPRSKDDPSGASLGFDVTKQPGSDFEAWGRTGKPNANANGWYFKPGDMKPAAPTFGFLLGQGEQKDGAAEPAKPDARRGLGAGYRGDRDKDGEKLNKQLASQFPPPVGAPKAPNAPAPEPAPQAVVRKIVIRSGDIDFEIDSFDSAVATVTGLVTKIKDAYISTVNSEKLPNGKVKGSVAVRVPPEALDSLVLDLRKELGKAGELKGQRIGSQDITKQYTDLESRLKAARTMEQRLLEIIKNGKGEIKQLLEAEKELGVWRTKIEEFEGELRYYANQVALSSLTITLAEKEIRAAAGLTENERVQAGIEVEDVEKTYQQAQAAVAEAKGRVTKAELKQLAAGQFNATLNFEVAPEAAGPIRDRLRQLGRVARLEIDRVQTPAGGTVQKDAKVTRGDTMFLVQLYNLANVAPRETDTLSVAVPDVPAGYVALQEAVSKAKGRVLTAKLDEQDRQNVTAQYDFEVRRADEGAVQSALAAAGDVVSRNVARAAEGDNVTDAKVLFRTTLVAAARMKPRETTSLAIEVADVDVTARDFGAQVADAKGRAVDAQVTHERSGRVTARLIYDVPFATGLGLAERFKGAGTVRVLQTARDPQAPDGKYATARLDVTLSNTDLIVPKDDGLLAQVRKGLSYSASVLLVSVTWLIFGLCVVLPWAIVGYGGYRLVRRVFRGGAAATPAAAPAASA